MQLLPYGALCILIICGLLQPDKWICQRPLPAARHKVDCHNVCRVDPDPVNTQGTPSANPQILFNNKAFECNAPKWLLEHRLSAAAHLVITKLLHTEGRFLIYQECQMRHGN